MMRRIQNVDGGCHQCSQPLHLLCVTVSPAAVYLDALLLAVSRNDPYLYAIGYCLNRSGGCSFSQP